MNRTRPKQIVIRSTEKEFERMKKKVSKSKLTQNEYLLRAILDKDIIVVEGIQDLIIELKKVGKNLNTLTKLANDEKLNCKEEIREVNEEIKEIWQSLKLLTQKVQ